MEASDSTVEERDPFVCPKCGTDLSELVCAELHERENAAAFFRRALPTTRDDEPIPLYVTCTACNPAVVLKFDASEAACRSLGYGKARDAKR